MTTTHCVARSRFAEIARMAEPIVASSHGLLLLPTAAVSAVALSFTVFFPISRSETISGALTTAYLRNLALGSARGAVPLTKASRRRIPGFVHRSPSMGSSAAATSRESNRWSCPRSLPPRDLGSVLRRIPTHRCKRGGN
jgi:hypothetical protein